MSDEHKHVSDEEQIEDLEVRDEQAEEVRGGDVASSILQAQHDTQKAIINNFRV